MPNFWWLFIGKNILSTDVSRGFSVTAELLVCASAESYDIFANINN